MTDEDNRISKKEFEKFIRDTYKNSELESIIQEAYKTSVIYGGVKINIEDAIFKPDKKEPECVHEWGDYLLCSDPPKRQCVLCGYSKYI